MWTKSSPAESPIFRASITGIDGAGKDTVAKLALQGISQTGFTTVKLGRPSYRFEDGQAKPIYGHITNTLDSFHRRADESGHKLAVKAASAMSLMTQCRILERAVSYSKPDVVASSRDPLVDAAVYTGHFAGKDPDSMSMAGGMTKMHRLTGVGRNLVVRLKVDPEVALGRIDRRLEAEAAKDTTGLVMQRGRDMHENPTELARIDRSYGFALTALQVVRPRTTVIEIETNDATPESVAAIAQFAILSSMNGDIERGARLVLGQTDMPSLVE